VPGTLLSGATITRGCLPAFAGKTSRQLFPLLCLAPHGVFRATPLTRRSGGLLPRLFTLTQHDQLPVSDQLSVVSCQLILTYSFAAKMRPPRFGNIWLRISVLFNRQLTLATDLTLTTDRAGRFIFCDTFRYPEFPLRIPSFSRGMPPSGVRTFLWPDKFQASDRLPLLERIPWTWIEIQPRHSAFTVCRSPKMLCAPVQVLRSSRRPRPI